MADLSITAANVVKGAGSTTRSGTCGTAAITAGDALYTLSGALELADTATAVTAACVGIALCDAAAGQPVVYLAAGLIDPGAIVAIGTYYALSATAGNIAPIADCAAGDFVTGLGFGTAADEITVAINASNVQVPA